MNENKVQSEKSFITIGLIMFITSIIIIIISLFLSWYKYTIILNGKSQAYTFYPFGGWIYSSNENLNSGLPDLFNLTIFMYYGIIIYAGIIIPTILLVIQKKKLSKNQSKYISYLIYMGPILIGLTFIQFILKLIDGGLYIPYLDMASSIYQKGLSNASFSIEKIYNVSIGLILNFGGLILLIYASCIVKNPNLGENNEKQFDSKNGLNQDKLKIDLPKNEEKWNIKDFQKGIQQIENQYIGNFSNINQNPINITQNKIKESKKISPNMEKGIN